MKFLKSAGFAARGIIYCIKTESHMRFHIVASLYVSVFACFYGLNFREWALLLITFAAVMSAEMINTAIERLSDAVSTEYNSRIKAAKDVAAGAVLIDAIFSVGIGIFIFGDLNKIIGTLENIVKITPVLVMLILSIPISVLFVANGKESRKK